MKKQARPAAAAPLRTLAKAPTGIEGLDEITQGGLPAGRPTLVCGAPGCGKTMLAMEFLIRGATELGEPGVVMMFEETSQELSENLQSLGFDLDALVAQGKLAVDYVRVERAEIEETGEYNLEGLFIRLAHAIDSVRAKRVVLDTLEALFAGLPNEGILRAELRRLFRWLKDRGMTAVITAERGESSLTRYGLEEYVADCVILLDHRVSEQVSTRRLRVVKYRGSQHGTNEYPFMIGARGLSVLPITSMRLDHEASAERVSTGIARLDDMFDGGGLYRGSSVLVSGTPGTGKSSIAALFAGAACRRGERVLLFGYEESVSQLLRNMRSIGLDLAPCIESGLLRVYASRPTIHGLEQHLMLMHELVNEFDPAVVIVDPISNLTLERGDPALKPTLMRLIDFLKQRQITALFTNLTTESEGAAAATQIGVSSLMDTWLLLSNVEFNGERTRTLQLIKSRGMAHSNQTREFVLSDHGVDLVDVAVIGDRVLTGSARMAHEHALAESAQLQRRDHELRLRTLASRRAAVEAQIAALQAQLSAETSELESALDRESASAQGSGERARQDARRRTQVGPRPGGATPPERCPS